MTNDAITPAGRLPNLLLVWAFAVTVLPVFACLTGRSMNTFFLVPIACAATGAFLHVVVSGMIAEDLRKARGGSLLGYRLLLLIIGWGVMIGMVIVACGGTQFAG
jgi:hypothetical protein